MINKPNRNYVRNENELRIGLEVIPKWSVMRILAALITVALAMSVVTACSKKEGVQGAWHNETYAQVFTFNEDGMYTLKTAAGEFTGIYVYDEDTEQGIVSVLGEDLPFTVGNDKLILGSEDEGQTEYERGDMAIALVTLTPIASEEPTPTASKEPTLTASKGPTPTEETAIVPTTSGTVSMLPIYSIDSNIHINPDVVGYLINSEILGVWGSKSNPDLTLEFKSDGTFQYIYDGADMYGGTFTYNPEENQGMMTREGGHEDPLAYNEAHSLIFAVFFANTHSFAKTP